MSAPDNNPIKKVIQSLPAISRRDVMTFSVFLFVSFFFWMVRNAYEQGDATYQVALQIENMPAGAVFTTHVPNSISVTLYDSKYILSDYHQSHSFLSLTVDFNRYADVAGNFRISGAELQSLLHNTLRSSTQITACHPALVDARYALTEGKRVPLRVRTELTLADNYKDFPPQYTPDSVLIHAPNYILDTLSCIQTECIVAEDIKDTLRRTVGMDLAVGVKATPDSIAVTIPVMQYVNKTIANVPIQVRHLPHGKRLILFPRQTDVLCLANFSHYSHFTSDDVTVTVDYDSLLAQPDRQYLPLQLHTDLDESEIYNVRLSVQQVEYTIEE